MKIVVWTAARHIDEWANYRVTYLKTSWISEYFAAANGCHDSADNKHEKGTHHIRLDNNKIQRNHPHNTWQSPIQTELILSIFVLKLAIHFMLNRLFVRLSPASAVVR